MKENLLGKAPNALERLAEELNMRRYRGRQIAEWLYHQHVASVSEMTNLSKADRTRLAAGFELRGEAPVARRVSRDETVKYAFAERLARTGGGGADGGGGAGASGSPRDTSRIIEATLIPDGHRRTLCLSTQIGCARGCEICATGRMGFHGNLSAGSIINQYRSLPERDDITNIVYMGMGEPLDNIEEVLESLTVFTDPRGYAMSPRRITVSTIGIPEPLERLLRESEVHVAVSLHSPYPEERARLIPAERRNSIHAVLEVLRRRSWDGRRRLSFEYALVEGLNDSAAHAKAVARLIDGIPARVNLIPVNPQAAVGFAPPGAERIEEFKQTLLDAGVRTTVRTSRGADIEAACGLLAGRSSDTITR